MEADNPMQLLRVPMPILFARGILFHIIAIGRVGCLRG